MNLKHYLIVLLCCSYVTAQDIPRLPKDIKASEQSFRAQAKLPDLAKLYITDSPLDLKDGIAVGTLSQPGAKQALQKLAKGNREGAFGELDSLLLWKDGKLIFEMYSRRGRVDAPHYAMSVTKTLTSITLARAIQMGFLSVDDLDRPIVDFLTEIDRSKIQKGTETITLRDALMMKSGLRWKDRTLAFKLGLKHKGQAYFQALFENTSPITPESKQYKYTGTDPSLIMMVIETKVGMSAKEFIKKELVEKVGSTDDYVWDNQGCGIPKCGAGSNFTSRTLLKFGIAVIQGGQYQGQQLLSADYIKTVTDTNKGEGYFYYFHNRKKESKSVNFISGVGAGGQYLSLFPEKNIVMVATSHNKGSINKPLGAMIGHLLPLFQD